MNEFRKAGERPIRKKEKSSCKEHPYIGYGRRSKIRISTNHRPGGGTGIGGAFEQGGKRGNRRKKRCAISMPTLPRKIGWKKKDLTESSNHYWEKKEVRVNTADAGG